MKKWFQKDEKFNELCAKKFKSHLERAKKGLLNDWKNSPEGCTGLVILLDQMSRNIYRNQPKAFESDQLALQIMKDTIQKGWDMKLRPFERMFLYMPSMHSEDLETQKFSVSLFTQLVKDNPQLKDALEYSIKHKEVIEKFNRFPHRNKILGRETSSEEEQFLKENGGF